jgi:hypothetical protein
MAGSVSIFNARPAQAFSLEGCQWSSVSPVHYYNRSSGTYHTVNDQAANNWTATPTAVWLAPSGSGSPITLYDSNDGNTGYSGWANYYCYYSLMFRADGHSNTYLTNQSQYSYGAKVSVMTHEVGHDLGLGHNDNTRVCSQIPVMYSNDSPRWFGCSINTPQKDDINGLLYMYG